MKVDPRASWTFLGGCGVITRHLRGSHLRWRRVRGSTLAVRSKPSESSKMACVLLLAHRYAVAVGNGSGLRCGRDRIAHRARRIGFGRVLCRLQLRRGRAQGGHCAVAISCHNALCDRLSIWLRRRIVMSGAPKAQYARACWRHHQISFVVVEAKATTALWRGEEGIEG
jgi:hypothetical protein